MTKFASICVIKNSSNQILLLQKPDKKGLQFPGGKIEIKKGESAAEAIQREIFEETSWKFPKECFKLEKQLCFKGSRLDNNDWHLFIYSLPSFKSFDYKNPVLSKEHIGFAWIHPELNISYYGNTSDIINSLFHS